MMPRTEGERRIALVVGNADYKTATPLVNPVNDALQMAGALERLGFEVKFARNCDINDFHSSLRDFTRSLGGSDVGLLYYSGHALQFDGENYLIPIDARLEEPDDLERRTFRLSPQLAAMRSAARVSLVFLDACRDDPFKLEQRGQGAGTKRVVVRQVGLREVAETELKDALIAFAAEQGHTAADGEEEGLSPFTKALVEHIETQGLEVTEMMRQVKRRVREATNGKQTPWSNDSLTEKFFFKPPVAAAATDQLAPRAQPAQQMPPQIVAQDFFVLLSQREAEVESGAEGLALRDVVRQAYRRLKPSNLTEPFFSFAAEVVASENMLEDCVRALCRAKVVIFDATGFEPAIMFLAGIRSVVRRGVTLLSVGGEYALGKEMDIPFNIKDSNIVAHSREQNKSYGADSVTLLRGRIHRGLTEMESPQYLDLPVYDSIRQLPTERRGIIPDEEGVLVLCQFNKDYETFWNNELCKALQNEMNALRDAKNIQVPPVVGVSRSFELNSPRLVTQAVYEAIRRMQSCVIDLTGWSPNVLFELGVRLAASGNRTVCIADRKWEEKVRPTWRGQCQNLASIFVADDFLYDPAQPWVTQKAYTNAYGPDALPPPSGLLGGKLHTLIERALDLECEPASRPVFVELQDHAALFSRDPGASGRSKPVGLFPGNAELVRREETAEFERLLAAWLYVSYRYAPHQILENTSIRGPVYAIIQSLFERHVDRLDAPMKDALSEMWDKIDAWGDANGRLKA
jgi:hypothetical protein